MHASSRAAVQTVLGGAALAGLLTISGCGNQAVSTDASLDSLGSKLAEDGQQAQKQVSGFVLANGEDVSNEKVSHDGTQDVGCPGGTRREFESTFTAPASAAGDSASEVRRIEGMASQATLKILGYEMATKPDGSALPARLEFANDPKDPADKRTFRTDVEVSGETFTWTISGRTPCVAKG